MEPPSLFDYREVVGPDVIEELTILASHVGGRSIKMVNSTAVGGGVAEMLRRVVPLLNELGVRVNWQVIRGDEPFYEITKAFHNALQGKDELFSEESFRKYLDINRMNYEAIQFDEDLIVIHDPQPAAMILWKGELKNRWVWRCHIDLSRPNPQLWEFLKPTIEKYDAAIFTSPIFSPELSIPQYRFFPAIDPLDDKNRDDRRILCGRGLREIFDPEGQACRHADLPLRPMEGPGRCGAGLQAGSETRGLPASPRGGQGRGRPRVGKDPRHGSRRGGG